MARRPSSVRLSVCKLLRKSLLLADTWPIATKLAHDGLRVSMHPGCAQGQGQGQRSRNTCTFCILGMSYSVIDGLVIGLKSLYVTYTLFSIMPDDFY